MAQKIIDLTHIIEPTGQDAQRKFVVHKHDALEEIPGKVRPEGEWYMEAGQGMGKVLQMASELDAYTLVDEGTWLKQAPMTRLEELSRGDDRLFNPYGIIAVNPEKHPHTNYDGAMKLVNWMTGIDGQRLIGHYKVEGKQLFTPSAATVAGTTQ